MTRTALEGVTYVRRGTRFTILGATVSYETKGPWPMNRSESTDNPVMDISRRGLGFLTNRPPRSERALLQVKYSSNHPPLVLQCRVAYILKRNANHDMYRYRVGVEFAPFSGGDGNNSAETLEILEELEKARRRPR